MMEEKEIHLRDYYRVVVKRKYTVFTFFAVVFVAVLLATLSMTPVYTASTKVLIEKSEPSKLAVTNFYYVPYDPDFYETQYQLIKSTSVAQKVVETLSLDRNYERYFKDEGKGFNVIGGTVQWFREIFSLLGRIAGTSDSGSGEEPEKEGAEEDSRVKALSQMISDSLMVSPIKNSKLVNISYQSTNPEFAAMVVNSVAKAYKEDLLDMKMSSSKYEMRWLTEKAEEEKAKLEKSEKALQEYMRDNDIVTLENRIAMVPEKLSEVATKLAAAETKRKEVESLYNKVKDVAKDIDKAETMPVIASDPTIQSLRTQILKAEQNIMDLSKKYGQKHPTMITAMADLKGLREKKEREIRRVTESIKNEYELARANEESLRRMAAQTKADTLNLSEKFIQYGVLKREAETNKQLYDAIIKRIKEQDVTQDIQTVDVWVVEKAEVPKYPSKPRKSLNIMLGLVLGLFGGVGLAFFIEYLDNTIKSPEDVETKLGLPVLGMVALLKSKDKSIDAIAVKEPQSTFAESYKALRTAILLSSAVKSPRNLLITSIGPGEGKTVTASNLALTIAQSEHKVLLVDGDLRKPRIHRVFDLDNSEGLSTYLAGASALRIVPSGVLPNLSLLPSGPVPPNPSELLGSSKMPDLLRVLGEKFDFIVWDSAPLLTVTDSLVLSRFLDGTIIVAKAGATTFESVARGLKSFRGRRQTDKDHHLLGVIINGIDLKSDIYYYRYYNYQYQAGEEAR